jgi:hypothetical protein
MFDRNGKFAGGSQVMHFVPHKGALFAAIGYWMGWTQCLLRRQRPERWLGTGVAVVRRQ